MSSDASFICRNTPLVNVHTGQTEDLLPTLDDDTMLFSNVYRIPGKPHFGWFRRPDDFDHARCVEEWQAGFEGGQCDEKREEEIGCKDNKNKRNELDSREEHAGIDSRQNCEGGPENGALSSLYDGSSVNAPTRNAQKCHCFKKALPPSFLPQFDHAENTDVWFRPLIDPMVDPNPYANIVIPAL